MNILLFGATGMVGQGVLRECILDPNVECVTTVGRAPTGRQEVKVRELVIADLHDLGPIEDELLDFDACFFCLGVSAAGMSEGDYTRVTHDLTLDVARTLERLNPDMTFVYVSGAGTDANGRAMWARVKGRTEQALLKRRLRVFLFRPGLIQPLHGARSKTALYRLAYAALTPLTPLLRRAFPRAVTTTEQVGRAMLEVARWGYPRRVLESADINAL